MRPPAADPDPPVRAMIFDFDGLLMDTETTLLQSWQYEWEQWGLSLSVNGFFAQHGGNINAERYEALARTVGPSFDRELSDRRRTRYRERLHRDLRLRPGIADWLTQAQRRSLRLAIASSSPHPAIYELAVRRLGIPAAAAVAVEDTAHGVDAAHAAALACIAIPNPHVPPATVSQAELTLRSAADLPVNEALARAFGRPT